MSPTREQRMTILYGILGTALVIVILQLWLLVTTMNAYLGGDFAVVWPAAIVSILCLLLNLGLLRYIGGLEALKMERVMDDASEQPSGPGAAISSLEPGLRTLHPAYFAMVMATGIVSIAAQLLDYRVIAVTLFAGNVVFYVVLWVLMAARLALYPRDFAADFSSHARGVGFFTWIAGTCVLATQFVVVVRVLAVAAALAVLGMVLWLVFIYGVIAALTIRAEKPPLTKGLNGGWLVAVVATQSISIITTQLAMAWADHAEPAPQMLFFALTMWLGGGMLYIWLISLIFYRYTFFVMEPGDLAPPYWINMGAVAISTLAGAFLVLAAADSPLLMSLLPFLKGFTLFFWATATWWIPMLVILGFWRHVYRRFPLRYDPLYWGAVFPLGMYTACTLRLAEALHTPFLAVIPRYFIFIALGAWLATFLGLVQMLLRRMRGRRGGGKGAVAWRRHAKA